MWCRLVSLHTLFFIRETGFRIWQLPFESWDGLKGRVVSCSPSLATEAGNWQNVKAPFKFVWTEARLGVVSRAPLLRLVSRGRPSVGVTGKPNLKKGPPHVQGPTLSGEANRKKREKKAAILVFPLGFVGGWIPFKKDAVVSQPPGDLRSQAAGPRADGLRPGLGDGGHRRGFGGGRRELGPEVRTWPKGNRPDLIRADQS